MAKKSYGKLQFNAEIRALLQLGPKEKVPKLAVLANVENEGTGDAHEVFVFLKVSGQLGIIRIPREVAQFEPKTVARMIVAKNGVLPREMEEAETVAKTASRTKPKEYWLEVEAEGWRPGFRAFVHRGRVIGRSRVDRVQLKAPSAKARRYVLGKKGRLERWKKMLLLAAASSRMRLGVCAAFAAPLLKVIDLQSFMLVIAGLSKAGKSTVLLVLSSVIGIGQESRLPNFNATNAALQEAATEFNDSVLPVNEIGLLKGPKRDAYQQLRPLIYQYAEGRDTGRHSKSTYSSPSGVASWRGIMVASSENGIDTLAELAGEKRDEGEYARAFDVPAVREGNSTVFDRFPNDVAVEDRDAWARQRLAEIRDLCSDNHGIAFHRYVAFLARHRATLKADVEEAMAEFLSTLKGAERSGAQQHAARNFAVLYAGAVMATKAGLLPWSLAATRKALRTCFMDGLQEISRIEGAEDRARNAILRQIGRLRPLTDATDPKAVDGWFTETRRGNLYAVRTPCFDDWFADLAEKRAALRWLHQTQLLKLTDNAKPDFPKTGWAVSFSKAGGTGHRCYQFWDPRKAQS